MSLNPDKLAQIIRGCRLKRCRQYGFPRDWCPSKIRNPDGGYFTDEAAWSLIADKLEQGHAYEVVSLQSPPGAPALEMLIELSLGQKPVYVKVQIGSGNVPIARSFHESYR